MIKEKADCRNMNSQMLKEDRLKPQASMMKLITSPKFSKKARSLSFPKAK